MENSTTATNEDSNLLLKDTSRALFCVSSKNDFKTMIMSDDIVKPIIVSISKECSEHSLGDIEAEKMTIDDKDIIAVNIAGIDIDDFLSIDVIKLCMRKLFMTMKKVDKNKESNFLYIYINNGFNDYFKTTAYNNLIFAIEDLIIEVFGNSDRFILAANTPGIVEYQDDMTSLSRKEKDKKKKKSKNKKKKK